MRAQLDPDTDRARRALCTRKIGYNTQAAARMAVKSMRSREGSYGRLRIFKCSFCSFWHLGNKADRRARSG